MIRIIDVRISTGRCYWEANFIVISEVELTSQDIKALPGVPRGYQEDCKVISSSKDENIFKYYCTSVRDTTD